MCACHRILIINFAAGCLASVESSTIIGGNPGFAFQRLLCTWGFLGVNGIDHGHLLGRDCELLHLNFSRHSLSNDGTHESGPDRKNGGENFFRLFSHIFLCSLFCLGHGAENFRDPQICQAKNCIFQVKQLRHSVLTWGGFWLKIGLFSLGELRKEGVFSKTGFLGVSWHG